MNVNSFDSFVNEAKKENPVAQDILKMLGKKPEVKSKGDKDVEIKFPNEKGIYSLAGIKNYFSDKYTSLKVEQALNELQNDKEAPLKHIKVKNYWDEEKFYPYYYHADKTTDEEAKKLKADYEEWSKENSKKDIEKRAEKRKRASEQTKPIRKGKKGEVTQKQLDALAKAREARKRKKTEKKNESIKTFSELMNEKLENELSFGKDAAKSVSVNTTEKGLPTADTIKGISIFLDDVDKKILSTIKDKGVAMSTYKISDCCGVDVKNVHNVLEKLQTEKKVIRKIIGGDDYWTV